MAWVPRLGEWVEHVAMVGPHKVISINESQVMLMRQSGWRAGWQEIADLRPTVAPALTACQRGRVARLADMPPDAPADETDPEEWRRGWFLEDHIQGEIAFLG